jgi:hypothetical protein
MGVVWKSGTGSASQSLIINLGTGISAPIDTVLLFGCTGAQAAWTLTVDGLLDNETPIAGSTTGILPFLAGAAMPTHGRGVGYWAGNAFNTLTKWRLTFGNLGGAAVTIGRVALGSRLQLDRNFAFGAGMGVRDLGSMEFSPSAALLRRRAAKLRTLGLTFPSVYRDEVEAKVQPLVEACAGQEPIVLVTDPEPHAMRQRRCYFGPMIGELGTVWRSAAGHEWRANLIDLVPIPKAAS